MFFKKELKNNELSFSGTVVTFNEMEHDYFGGALTLLGKSKRKEAVYEKPVKIGFVVPKSIWNKLLAHNINKGSDLNVIAHFEMWTKTKLKTDGEFKDVTKTLHVIDDVNFLVSAKC